MKKILLVVLLILVIPISGLAYGENTVENGDFQSTDDIEMDFEVTIFEDTQDASLLVKQEEDDNKYLELSCKSENYLSIKQPVFLRANSTYEIGAKVKYYNIDGGNQGAYLKLENDQARSSKIQGTMDEWQDIKFFVTTLGSDVYTGLEIATGSFDSYCKGKLLVDDIYVTEVANVAHEGAINIVDEKMDVEQAMPETIEVNKIETILNFNQKISLILLLFCLSFFMITITWFSLKTRSIISYNEISYKLIKIYLAIGILIIVVYKYVVASLGTDLPSDIGYFTYWSDHLVRGGIRYFYQNIKGNYPAGYMYVLYIVGKIANLFSISYDSLAYNFLLKTPVIITEVLTSLLAFKISKKHLGNVNALIFALIVLLNPSNLINTSAWGQLDAVFIFFIVAALYLLEEKRYYLAAVSFALTLLIKTQGIFFLPVVGIVYLMALFKSKSWAKLAKFENLKKVIQKEAWVNIYNDHELIDGIKTFFISIGIVFAVYFGLFFPFRGDSGLLFPVKNFFESAATFNYVSMNGFNLFTLFGANYIVYTEKFFIFSYQTWGYIFISLFSIFSVALCVKHKDKKALFLIAAFLMAAIFTFGHGMHERYIVPTPVLLFFAYIYLKDRNILNAAVLYTVFSLLSQIAVLFFFDVEFYKAIEFVLSVMSVACFGYLFYVVYILLIKNGTVIQKVERKREEEEKVKNSVQINRAIQVIKRRPALNLHKKHERAFFGKEDRVIVGIMMLVYAIVAFINLGSINVPKSGFEPTEDNQSVVIEFENKSDVDQIKYYFGLGKTIIDIEISNDNRNFNSIEAPQFQGGFFNIDHSVGSMYKWNFIDCDFDAEYVKLTFRDKDIDVKEIAFIDDNNKVINIVNIKNTSSSDGANYLSLVDEQEKVKDVISYKDGMYFDEIYHARTALEHIEGIQPYEITHPPLGKSLISIGIRIFGMNPFGWRFMGTLFGIFMIPLMYILAKKIFKRIYLSFIATFLLMFDFMHFSQTRMATIDSFSVFFIMMMFFFMYDYYKTNFNNEKLSDTFVPLALCGISFGLGAATKWLCLYAGVGIAIIFFFCMIQRYREYKAAKLIVMDRKTNNLDFYRTVINQYPRKLAMTLLFCIGAFIIVPLIIYYLSYIPYMRGEGAYGFKQILENQSYMFDYHSLLDTSATPHPFASKWYSWIFDIRPVYLFQGKGYPDRILSSLSTFGNPIIWWSLFPAIIVVLIAKYNEEGFNGGLGFVIIAGLSEFVPWIFIARETYIYHYFATVPFMILFITFACKYVWEKVKRGKIVVIVYLFLVIIAFILFYPVITGVPASRVYCEGLRWLDTWPFY